MNFLLLSLGKKERNCQKLGKVVEMSRKLDLPLWQWQGEEPTYLVSLASRIFSSQARLARVRKLITPDWDRFADVNSSVVKIQSKRWPVIIVNDSKWINLNIISSMNEINEDVKISKINL